MNKKYMYVLICLVVISLFISGFMVNKYIKNVKVNLSKNEIKQISISYSMPLFDEFDITDTKQVNKIVDYLNSLNKKNTKKNTEEYVGGGYTIKVYLKSGAERTLFLEGNMFFKEANRFVYEIPYKEAIKFHAIVASILEENQSNKGEASVVGTIISVDSHIMCSIETKGNVNYNIDLKDIKIIDATGAGNLLVHKKDKIKVFYDKDGQTDSGIIHANMVFIEGA